MEEANQPQQENALDHKWYLIHMDEDWISNIGIHWSSSSYYWTSHCYWSNELESI